MKPVTFNISVTITCDDGSGKAQTFTIPVEQSPAPKKKAKAKPVEDVRAFDPAMLRYLESGDISEIQAMPDHKQLFKHYVFVQINGMKGRTLHAGKMMGGQYRSYVGILGNQWDDDIVAHFNEQTAAGSEINAVILDDGNKPALILDLALVEKDWSSLGKIFNSLYRNPGKYA